MMNQTSLPPVLLFGGPSAERMVSVASAQNVLANAPFALEALFIDTSLRIFAVSAESVLAHQDPFTVEFKPSGAGLELDEALARLHGRSAFIALHGTWGEDGSLQDRLDQAGISYSGSGAAACRLAFDKTMAKALMSGAGFRIPAEINLLAGLGWTEQLPRILASHGPFVLKPVCNGSSIGLHMVRNEATARSVRPDGDPADYIAEELIVGREFTVGVIENPDGLCALPVSEVCMSPDSNFDYSGKYLGKGSTEITPARIDDDLARQLGRIAIEAHTLCGCRGFSRTDILCDSQGPVFLEINTHPGLSRASFIPQQLRAAGASFGDFLTTQMKLIGNLNPDRSPLRR